MKNSMVVLALGALVCALVCPLGAAVWAEPHPVCGCSLEVCICPHVGQLAGAARHDHGHHAGARHTGHHAAQHALHTAQPSTPGSGDASPCHQRTSEHGDAGVSCTLRSCGSGSMPGTGALPALPDGDFLASPAMPAPVPCGSPSLEDSELPPDVFPGVESPPPRR